MFNPSELEGEVDHSFFDSDCDNSSGNEGKGGKKDLKAKQQSPAKHVNSNVSQKTRRTKKHSKQVDIKKRNRASNISVSCTLDKTISDSADSEDDAYLHSKTPSGTIMALLSNTQDIDDTSNQTPDEMEEKTLASRRKNQQSPENLVRHRHPQSPSPTSTLTDGNTDSDSFCDLEPYHSPKATRFSSHTGRRRVGSAGSHNLPNASADESDDTVTGVRPLSFPEYNPQQSLHLTHADLEDRTHEEQQQESVPSSGPGSVQQEEDLCQNMDDLSLSLGCELDHKLVHYPGGRNRKNYSFSNEEVRRIDQENQRLLRVLSRQSPASRPGRGGKKAHVASNSPVIRLTHSALNRQRAQERIERENLAFLKRLESVKASPDLRRSKQLADYQHQARYLVRPFYPTYGLTTKKESTRSSSGARPLSFPEYNPQQSLHLTHADLEDRTHEEQQQESVPSSGPGSVQQEEDLCQNMDDLSLSLGCELDHKLVHYPGGRNRKNYSFSNEEVRRIDQENQRLRVLSRQSPASRPGRGGKKAHVASHSPVIRLTHSALNRQRAQEHIERENLAFLKRLESVKASSDLRRSKQLADYQHQARYLVRPFYPTYGLTTKKESTRSSSASAGPRSISSSTAFTDTDSSSTPVPMSKKLNAS